MSPCEKLLEGPHAPGHVVQLYDKSEPQSLVANVRRYLGEGLRRGEGALVIATPEHRDLFWRELETSGIGIVSAVECGQLALWNRLLAQSSFSLYCSYEIDSFGKDFHPRSIDVILRMHTLLVPAQLESNLETTLHRAIDEVLGPCAENAKAHNGARRHCYWALMPTVEAIVLGLRERFPSQADDILARAWRHCLQ